MMNRLFKGKNKRIGKVEAIVNHYGKTLLPLPDELVEAARREGLSVPETKPTPPAPEPPALSEPKRQAVPDVKPATPIPEPVPSSERTDRVVPDEKPTARKAGPAILPEKKDEGAPLEKPAHPEPKPSAAPGKDGWVSPTYIHSRQVTLNAKHLMANRCVGYLCGSYESESYKVLRTRILQKTGEQGGTTIMITSALPGEGKTLTAVNLSLTFAKEYNQTVLLVDSDLHRQSVHECLGFESRTGLADYLLDGTSLGDLIVWPGVEKFTVISGGKTVTTSSELLGSPRMKGLVKDLKYRYPDRYVFFDVPPVLAGADALAFAPQVDHIILVVRAGSTSIEDVRLALDLLPREKVLGVVLNRADAAVLVGRHYSYGKDGGEPRRGTKWDRIRGVVRKE
ncbi:MAG: Tyrosine-protein kinase YwqD [Deltaproteobacteria bacterium ADurb.BinA179]|jgi:non-specific protein-tyrosine kinase|nr:AAA family ATPase [Syntrophaceae bacterium]MDI9554929.1 AAA family ATPase [Pseudomonadota bacterium]NLX32653.1 AAA family ATPase [Deltaproteobacteria bacterium]OPZ25559.1 MAG: Tyrosine-protein kinase YwqD [Deltaproteobacteria bacterium ADurb.BinA179]HNZ35817.1 AAA family ATPase [Syntrophales bacterium]